jgi:protein phosphatase
MGKYYVYQKKGILETKIEMEDRALVGKNILAGGYHCGDITDELVLGVFDGVGGLKGSAKASALTAYKMSELARPVDVGAVFDCLRGIHTYLVNNTSTATTASGIIRADKDNTILFHIGNTRICALQNGYLVPMTEDMTNYETMLRAGFSENTLDASLKGVLTACLGVKEEFLNALVLNDFGEELARSEKLLITSDGIHDSVSEDDLENFLKGEITEESMKAVIEKALQAGSKDDLSILVVDLR